MGSKNFSQKSLLGSEGSGWNVSVLVCWHLAFQLATLPTDHLNLSLHFLSHFPMSSVGVWIREESPQGFLRAPLRQANPWVFMSGRARFKPHACLSLFDLQQVVFPAEPPSCAAEVKMVTSALQSCGWD